MAYPPMHDNSTLPFGKWKGARLIDVPASWLLWYLKNGSPGTLMDYCIKAEEALLEEVKNQKVRVAPPVGEYNTNTREYESKKTKPYKKKDSNYVPWEDQPKSPSEAEGQNYAYDPNHKVDNSSNIDDLPF